MKTKKTLPIVITLTILFSILYLIFGAKPLSKEFQFTPEWKISITNPVIAENPNHLPEIYYKLGQEMGYFTEDGKVTLSYSFNSMSSISDYYYAPYTTNAINTVFYNNKGQEAGVITEAGYPYFLEDAAFVFLPGGNSFSKLNNNGSTAWTYEGTMPITAFTSKNDYTAVGFADGRIMIFENEAGKREIDFAPGGSDYPVILGLDISSDGKYVASVTGHEKQRFIVSQKENNQEKIVFHTFIDKSSPIRTLVHFTKDNKRVFYLFEGNLGIYNIETDKHTVIPMKDRIFNIEESDDHVFLLGTSRSTYTIYVVDKTNTLEGKTSFEADTAFIRAFNNNLYIGKNSSISKIKLSKE